MRYILSSMLLLVCVSAIATKLTTSRALEGFLPNEGQVLGPDRKQNLSVKYLWSNGAGLNVQLREGGFAYDTYRLDPSTGITHFHRLDVALVNMNANASMSPRKAEEVAYRFRQMDKDNGKVLHPYREVIYADVYPGIDLLYTFEERAEGLQFKYDFIVHPDADASQIDLEYSGYNDVKVEGNSLYFDLNYCILQEYIPLSYVLPAYEEIAASYCIHHTGNASLRLGYEGTDIRSADQSLVIDPVAQLQWSSYYGGEQADVVTSITLDSLASFISVGHSASSQFIASEGSHQGSFTGGNADAFITRFNQHGLRFWATYYGGSGDDYALGASANNNGHIYMVGKSNSPEVLDSTAYQMENAGDFDGFIARFTRDGELVWDTYFGGTDFDEFVACMAMEDGTLLALGNTRSASFSTNASNTFALNGSYMGEQDAFVLRIDEEGIIQKGLYIGGHGDDFAHALAMGNDSLLYIAGHTLSSTGLGGLGFLQNEYSGGEDGFVSRTSLELFYAATGFVGADGDQRLTGVVADSSGIYLAGYTTAPMAYADTSSHQAELSGASDGFILSVDYWYQPRWFTYLGGEGDDVVNGISIDQSGEVFVVGTTHSDAQIDEPDSTGVSQTSHQGNGDAFVMRFSKHGEKIWGRYHGGMEAEQGLTLAAFGVTAIFFGGSTHSLHDMTAANGTYSELHQEMYSGGGDGFLARITQMRSTPAAFCNPGSAKSAYNSNYNAPPSLGFCIGDSLQISVAGGCLGWGAQWIWYEGDCGVTDAYIGEGESIWVSPQQTTTYYVRAESVDYVSSCTSAMVFVDLPPTAIAFADPDTACAGTSIQMSAAGANNYSWSGPLGFTSISQNPLLDSLHVGMGGSYTVLASTQFGCVDTAVVSIHILPSPQISLSGTAPSCPGFDDGSAIAASVAPGIAYLWPHSGSTIPMAINLQAGSYTALGTDENGCTGSASITLNDPESPTDSIAVIPAYCDQRNGALEIIFGEGNAPFEVMWSPGDFEGPAIVNLGEGNYTALITDANGCLFSSTANVPHLGFFTASITPADSLYLEIGEEVVLGVQISPNIPQADLSYAWLPAEGLNCSDCPNPIANPDTTGSYSVMVTSIYGCSASDTLFIERERVLSRPFIPTVFSPNNDGLNDQLCVLSNRIVTMQLEIYNRFGQRVFESKDQGNCWDGTYNGSPVEGGAYVFNLQVSLDDGEAWHHRGNLSVVR